MVKELIQMVIASMGLNNGWGPSTLDAKDVRFFEIVEKQHGLERFIHIDGLIFHSSLSVKKIDFTYKDEFVLIKISLMPATPESSGSFALDIPLKNDTRGVLFGKSETQIWPSSTR